MAGLLAIPDTASQLSRAAAQLRAGLASKGGRRALLLLITVALVATLAWAVSAVLPDGGRPVVPGLAEAERSEAVDLLKASGFSPHIDSATGEVMIAEADYHRARMALAAAGLPKSVPVGYAVLDNLPLGISRSVETARLRQAQETDLATSIRAISGVEFAQVHLATTEASPFVRDDVAPTAAVFLRLAPGRALGQGQTDAIVHLVSASVSGLAADRVSVVDQSGRLLTSGVPGKAATGRAQLDYGNELEARYRSRISSLLLPLVGAGNFSTEVTLDIDFSRVQSTRERVDPGNVAVSSEQGGGASGTPPPAAGIPGALSNVIPATAQAVSQLPKPFGPAPAASAGSQDFNRTFEVGRTIEVVEPSEGRLRKISAGIILRSGAGIGPKQLVRITNLVRDAIGYDLSRGDRVSVVIEPFADPVVAEGTWWTSELAQVGERIGLPLLIGLILTFGVARPITKRLLLPTTGQVPATVVHHLSPVDQLKRVEAVRVFVRDNPATASRALRQLVRSVPAA